MSFASTYNYINSPPELWSAYYYNKTNREESYCWDKGTAERAPAAPGYKYADLVWCGGAFWSKKFERDPSSEHWNPLPTKMGGNASLWKPEDLATALDCCTGKTLTGSAEGNCGLFHNKDESGVEALPGQCIRVIEQYCNSGNNINTDICKNMVAKNPAKYQTKLNTVCRGKENDKAWDELCACNYPYEYYKTMADELQKKWYGPPDGFEAKGICINPRCVASRFKDTTDKCANKNSFATCVQNTELNLRDTIIGGKAEIRQQCNIDLAADAYIKKEVGSTVTNADGTKTVTIPNIDSNGKVIPDIGGPKSESDASKLKSLAVLKAAEDAKIAFDKAKAIADAKALADSKAAAEAAYNRNVIIVISVILGIIFIGIIVGVVRNSGTTSIDELERQNNGETGTFENYGSTD